MYLLNFRAGGIVDATPTAMYFNVVATFGLRQKSG